MLTAKRAQVQQDFAQLCMEYNIDYKDAPTVRSPRGGTHIYLGLTEKVAGNRDILGIKYIDTRSYGNFILAPPSRNKEGKRYTWVEGKSIFDNLILPPASGVSSCYRIANDSRRLVESKAGEVVELNAEFKQQIPRSAHGVNRLLDRDAVCSKNRTHANNTRMDAARMA